MANKHKAHFTQTWNASIKYCYKRSSGGLSEKLQGVSDQVNRLVSHVDSEQRVSSNHEKRIDSTEKMVDRIQKQLDDHDTVLYNSGKGLIFEVRSIKESKKENRNWWRDLASVASLLIALALAIKEILA